MCAGITIDEMRIRQTGEDKWEMSIKIDLSCWGDPRSLFGTDCIDWNYTLSRARSVLIYEPVGGAMPEFDPEYYGVKPIPEPEQGMIWGPWLKVGKTGYPKWRGDEE